jgi:hypothetical protein
MMVPRCPVQKKIGSLHDQQIVTRKIRSLGPRHSRESGNPEAAGSQRLPWTLAFAGATAARQ